MKGSNFLKKTVVTAALAAGMVFSLTAGGQAEAAPSGTDTTVVSELSALHDISLDGIASYKIVDGDSYTMTVSGDKAYVEALTIDNQDGYLAVSADADQPVEVVITTPSFDALAVSGQSVGVIDGYNLDHAMDIYLNKDSSLSVDGEFKAPAVGLYVSMSQIDGTFNTEDMNVSGHSGSSLNLQGFSRNLNAEITGSTTANFDGMAVSDAKIETRQSASVLADFPGISKVDVDAYNESSLNLTMNGILSANVYTDSSLVYSGDVSWAGRTLVADGEGDDAYIRMN